MDHPYPDHAYLERDPETNEKRWFSTRGMGVQYIHEDRAAEDIAAAVAAEREACAKVIESGRHDGLTVQAIIDEIRARTETSI